MLTIVFFGTIYGLGDRTVYTYIYIITVYSTIIVDIIRYHWGIFTGHDHMTMLSLQDPHCPFDDWDMVVEIEIAILDYDESPMIVMIDT